MVRASAWREGGLDVGDGIPANIATVVECNRTIQVRSFLPVTTSTTFSRSTSARSRPRAWPRPSPLAVIRLITAWIVAAGAGSAIVGSSVNDRCDLGGRVQVGSRPTRLGWRQRSGRRDLTGRGERVQVERAKPLIMPPGDGTGAGPVCQPTWIIRRGCGCTRSICGEGRPRRRVSTPGELGWIGIPGCRTTLGSGSPCSRYSTRGPMFVGVARA